jgi:hypothetical protein
MRTFCCELEQSGHRRRYREHRPSAPLRVLVPAPARCAYRLAGRGAGTNEFGAPDMARIMNRHEELKLLFEMQAEWRRDKARQHPGDARNIEAADIFDRLAATAASVPADVLAAYYELFEDLPDVEEEQEMLRRVGFYSKPSNAEEFVRKFIARRTAAE